jgi:hypothetical protein
LHREVRSHVAWLPGAREFLTRMRAAGKRLLLLTNSHPCRLAVKHEQTGVLDYLDASVTSHDFGIRRRTRASGTPPANASDSIRGAACSPTTIRACWMRRVPPASAGCSVFDTGTRVARDASTWIITPSTESLTWTVPGEESGESRQILARLPTFLTRHHVA